MRFKNSKTLKTLYTIWQIPARHCKFLVESRQESLGPDIKRKSWKEKLGWGIVGERRPGCEHRQRRRVKVGLDLSLARDWAKRDERADNFPLWGLRSVIQGGATITTSRPRHHSLLLTLRLLVSWKTILAGITLTFLSLVPSAASRGRAHTRSAGHWALVRSPQSGSPRHQPSRNILMTVQSKLVKDFIIGRKFLVGLVGIVSPIWMTMEG